MYIRWRERESWVTTGHAWEAELARSERVNGRVRRVSVAYLGSVQRHSSQPFVPASERDWGNGRTEATYRVRFWLTALPRLASALAPGDVALASLETLRPFITTLAARVPLATPQETAWYARYYAVEANAKHACVTGVVGRYTREAHGLALLRALHAQGEGVGPAGHVVR